MRSNVARRRREQSGRSPPVGRVDGGSSILYITRNRAIVAGPKINIDVGISALHDIPAPTVTIKWGTITVCFINFHTASGVTVHIRIAICRSCCSLNLRR